MANILMVLIFLQLMYVATNVHSYNIIIFQLSVCIQLASEIHKHIVVIYTIKIISCLMVMYLAMSP